MDSRLRRRHHSALNLARQRSVRRVLWRPQRKPSGRRVSGPRSEGSAQLLEPNGAGDLRRQHADTEHARQRRAQRVHGTLVLPATPPGVRRVGTDAGLRQPRNVRALPLPPPKAARRAPRPVLPRSRSANRILERTCARPGLPTTRKCRRPASRRPDSGDPAPLLRKHIRTTGTPVPHGARASPQVLVRC